MPVLMWTAPAQIMTTEQWKAISADGAPPGVYTPNMSRADREAWKAVLRGRGTRVEIRRTVAGTQVLIVVTAGGACVSMNGAAPFTFGEIEQLAAGITEAKAVLAQIAERTP